MSVKIDTNMSTDTPSRKITQEAMQRDFDYRIADNLMHMLLDKGFITETEYEEIRSLNSKDFHPFLEGIM